MGTGIEVALIAGIALAAVGAGVSAYGQHQQGKSQEVIAQFNAAQREREAQQQLMAMQVQASLQRQEAEANFAFRQSEAGARHANAAALDQQALAQDAIARQNGRKRLEDFQRLQGEQRASIAASGLAESAGTPLDILAETAARIQQDREEQHYANDVQRNTLFAEAEKERLGGRMALVGATLDRDSRVAEAALREAAGQGRYQAELRGAEIMRLTGRAQRQGATWAAAGTLLSGLSSGASDYAKYHTT